METEKIYVSFYVKYGLGVDFIAKADWSTPDGRAFINYFFSPILQFRGASTATDVTN